MGFIVTLVVVGEDLLFKEKIVLENDDVKTEFGLTFVDIDGCSVLALSMVDFTFFQFNGVG
eukprot:8934655-Heterocapsa_arctica.AAC.1